MEFGKIFVKTIAGKWDLGKVWVEKYNFYTLLQDPLFSCSGDSNEWTETKMAWLTTTKLQEGGGACAVQECAS